MSTILSTPGAKSVAERRLRSVIEGLNAGDLDEELDQAARFLQAKLPSLAPYNTLSDTDKAFYDIVVGLTAAIRLLAPAIASSNDGLSKLKTPEYEYTFIVPSVEERETWAAEVREAYGYLSAAQVQVRQGRGAAFSLFGAAGVTRQRERLQRHCHDSWNVLLPDEWLIG